MDRSKSRAGDEVPAAPSPRVRDLPAQLRPREEMRRVGAQNMSDAGLLAIIMRGGARGCSVVELAERLVTDYGSLTALSRCSVEELTGNRRYQGLGPVRTQCLHAALEIGRRMTREAMPRRVVIRTPADVERLLADEVRRLDTEVFWVLLLDAKNGLRGQPREVSRGLLDGSLVHPREVFVEAVRTMAKAVLLAHNHPSGDPTPSAEDLRVTRQIVESGRLLDINVLDHVILARSNGEGRPALVSMREEGLVRFGKETT